MDKRGQVLRRLSHLIRHGNEPHPGNPPHPFFTPRHPPLPLLPFCTPLPCCLITLIFSQNKLTAPWWTCAHTQQESTSFIPSKRSDFNVAVMAREARITPRLSQHDTPRHACQTTSPIHSTRQLSPLHSKLILTSLLPAVLVFSIGTIPHHRATLSTVVDLQSPRRHFLSSVD